jgi:5-methylthioadenosine/S-adenosylhomocysteine deaminase
MTGAGFMIGMLKPKLIVRWAPLSQRMIHLLFAWFCTAILQGANGSEPAKLLVKNAWIVSMDPGTPDPFHGYLLVAKDGRLITVAEGTPPEGLDALSVLDAGGKVLMPGFLSGHSHLWQSAFRGVAPDHLVMAWVTLLHRTYGPFFTKGDLYAFTLHGALDYLRHGITTAFNYSQTLNLPNELYEEEYAAELDAGERFVFGYALPNRPPFAEARRNFEDFYRRVGSGPPQPLLLEVSLVSESLDSAYLDFFFAMMREHGLNAQMHYLEAPDATAQQRIFPAIEASGLLGPRISFAHFIHTNEEILQRSGAAGVGMSWNPLSNGRLGSGFADIPRYLKAGVQVGMGLDGQASADIADPFENMRMGLYSMRDKYEDAAILHPVDVLRLHTIGTAKVLGVADKVGSLVAGKYADFLIVDLGLMDPGPVFDLYATLVFACDIANVESVYIGGDLAVDRGQPVGKDMKAISADIAARVARIRAKFEVSKAAPKAASAPP